VLLFIAPKVRILWAKWLRNALICTKMKCFIRT